MSPETRVADGDAFSDARAAEYSDAYERMRACVIEGAALRSSSQRQVGLGLVLHEGVAGWLKAAQTSVCSALGNHGDIPASSRRDGGSSRSHTMQAAVATIAPEILPLARQPDLTLLIANMVASTQRTQPADLRGEPHLQTQIEEVVSC